MTTSGKPRQGGWTEILDADERDLERSIYLLSGVFCVFAAVAHWVFGVSSKELEYLAPLFLLALAHTYFDHRFSEVKQRLNRIEKKLNIPSNDDDDE
jgi:hypothetical protein